MPQFERLKESSKSKIVFVRNWVVFVIVTVSTIECQAKERFSRMLDIVFHPSFVVPFVPVAN